MLTHGVGVFDHRKVIAQPGVRDVEDLLNTLFVRDFALLVTGQLQVGELVHKTAANGLCFTPRKTSVFPLMVT